MTVLKNLNMKYVFSYFTRFVYFIIVIVLRFSVGCVCVCACMRACACVFVELCALDRCVHQMVAYSSG